MNRDFPDESNDANDKTLHTLNAVKGFLAIVKNEPLESSVAVVSPELRAFLIELRGNSK